MLRFKKMVPLFIGLLGLVFSIGSQGMAETGKDWGLIHIPIRTIYIGPPGDIIPRRPPAYFPHPVHFDYSCKTCHHAWDGYTRIQSCSAAGCHDATEAPKKRVASSPESKSGIQYYKYAYHNMCIGCHRQIKVKNKKLETSRRVIRESIAASGPTSCDGCHQRE